MEDYKKGFKKRELKMKEDKLCLYDPILILLHPVALTIRPTNYSLVKLYLLVLPQVLLQEPLQETPILHLRSFAIHTT